MAESTEDLIPAIEREWLIKEAVRRCPSPKPSTGEVLDEFFYLKALMDRKSVFMRTAYAVPIPARVISVSFEESSSRYLITYLPVRGYGSTDSKEEHVRSDRTDGRNGKAISEMCSDLAGRNVIIYKTTQKTNDPESPTVRIAPYIRVVH